MKLLPLILATALASPVLAQTATPQPSLRKRTAEQEVLYFMLPDRFENGDSRNDKGGLKGARPCSNLGLAIGRCARLRLS